jgi:hypothetical protein
MRYISYVLLCDFHIATKCNLSQASLKVHIICVDIEHYHSDKRKVTFTDILDSKIRVP